MSPIKLSSMRRGSGGSQKFYEKTLESVPDEDVKPDHVLDSYRFPLRESL
eukprot:CAMPEP_0114576044 /NCGR_PEP_ID=MMETSP0125-20121206/840_1 /TAXON_ID=485358 ORGANISM="Aristerostoma sp., Strain ATCC 50986" /NCGR_SAMPLE_ID=MMETSP0125 /ASSEMBLY_ACC=CAM_ASM_000245 /LENGTH=49 /DNA_ID=CAMNT_0001764233 /DNA_START=182 /DNA_END=331 /DNA_ORIENTATION=+